MYSTSNSALSQRRSRNWRNCSTLPSIAWRLTLLRDTPAVSAISGSTSAYSRLETPRNSAPIMRCAVASFSCRDSYAGTLTSPPSLWRRRGRFTLICRSARLTRPFCDPCQRISPLLLPGVRGPGYLFGTQTQNGFDGLAPDVVDHFIDSHASLRDQFHQRKQNLS